jgi:hypothetical protein
MQLFVGWRYNCLQHIGRRSIHKFFFTLFSIPVTMFKIETETTYTVCLVHQTPHPLVGYNLTQSSKNRSIAKSRNVAYVTHTKYNIKRPHNSSRPTTRKAFLEGTKRQVTVRLNEVLQQTVQK